MNTPLVLDDLIQHLHNYSGIKGKTDIHKVCSFLQGGWQPEFPIGDDTGVVRSHDGMYDLFSGEAFIPEFVSYAPWHAGWCGVMVNASDIAAMGGWATGVINMLWAPKNDCDQVNGRVEQFMKGMAAASTAYQIPILGGHTNLNAVNNEIHAAVSITGKAKRLLNGLDAKVGQRLVCVYDLRGHYENFLNWNAATSAPYDRLRGDLACLPQIAEQGFAHAAKDISQAGVIGTLLMMLEGSGVGAEVRIEDIPKPSHVSWQDWLCTFPSFGFVLSTDEEHLDDLLETFHKRDIAASEFGVITEGSQLNLNYQQESGLFWDWQKEAYICAPQHSITNKNQMTDRHQEASNA